MRVFQFRVAVAADLAVQARDEDLKRAVFVLLFSECWTTSNPRARACGERLLPQVSAFCRLKSGLDFVAGTWRETS